MTTFTETVAGEIVMLMLVTGSVQVEVDVVLVDVEVVEVHVIAVLAGAAPQEVRPSPAASTRTGARDEASNPNFKFEISNLKFQTQIRK